MPSVAFTGACPPWRTILKGNIFFLGELARLCLQKQMPRAAARAVCVKVACQLSRFHQTSGI